MLTNDRTNDFLQLLQHCFDGSPASGSKEIDALYSTLTAAFGAFRIELGLNISNAQPTNQKAQLNGIFAELEVNVSSMLSDSRSLDALFIAKGWNPASIVYDNPVPIERQYAAQELESTHGTRFSQLRRQLDFGVPVDGLFDALTPSELEYVQRGIGCAFLKKAWQEVNKQCKKYGYITREVPRREGYQLVVDTPVLQDLRLYVPGIRELTATAYEAHALEEWATHLSSVRWWNYPFSRPWPAPIEYERAFHDAPDRSAFLSGLRRLLDAVEPILAIPDEDNLLFREDNQVFFEAEREEMRRYALRRARVIAKRMGRWLQLRQKLAEEQFLEALERILLVPEWDVKWKPTSKLTVAYYHTEHDAELHFDFLLTRLRENMPRNHITLSTFQRRLEQFLDNPLAKLTRVGFDVKPSSFDFKSLHKALIDQFPQYTFVDGVSDITDEQVGQFTEDFWSRFAETISWRMPWARKALKILPSGLGENSTADTPASGMIDNAKADVKSLLLDDYILPGFERHSIDAFLLQKGLLKSDKGVLIGVGTHRAGTWAAVRSALNYHEVIIDMPNQLAADVFAYTYKVSVSKNTMNYIPAERSLTNTWRKNDKFYYDLLEAISEAFFK